jgi:hypothetical protein
MLHIPLFKKKEYMENNIHSPNFLPWRPPLHEFFEFPNIVY